MLCLSDKPATLSTHMYRMRLALVLQVISDQVISIHVRQNRKAKKKLPGPLAGKVKYTISDLNTTRIYALQAQSMVK